MEYNDMKPAIIGVEVILNLILNTVVIAVLARYPELREDRYSLFMLSLSVADLASGCTSMPIGAAVCSRATSSVLDNQLLAKLCGLTTWWFTTVSMYSVCWVNMSKAIAIITPFRSEYLLSRKRCYVIIALTWIIGFLLATVHFSMECSLNTIMCTYGYTRGSGLDMFFLFYSIVAAVVPRILLTYGTIRIFIVVKRTKYQVAAQANSVVTVASGMTNAHVITAQAIKSSISVLILCVVTLLLTTPFFVYSIIRNGTKMDTPLNFGFYALRCLECNTILNSLLYLLHCSAVRKKTVIMLSDMFTSYIRC